MVAPRLSDIARRAGVSAAAVSIALSDRNTTRVSAAKRDLIYKIAGEMSYSPNEFAKALAKKRSQLLGLMVPMRDPIFFNQFIAQALSGIQSTLMKRGYNLLIYSPSGRPGRTTRDQIMESRYTDGLIFINTRSCAPQDINQTIRDLNDARVHFAMMNSYYGRAPVNYVGVDDAAIGEAAIRYLVHRGHKRIAFLSGESTLPTHIHLLQGLRRALTDAGLEMKPEHIGCSHYDQTQAFSIMDRWFGRKKDRPTAIFAADDTLLVHVYDYVEARRIAVPGDVAILARANSANAGGLRPHPTAFFMPVFEMGQLAADMVIDSIEKPERPPQRVLLPFTFSQGSTA